MTGNVSRPLVHKLTASSGGVWKSPPTSICIMWSFFYTRIALVHVLNVGVMCIGVLRVLCECTEFLVVTSCA